MSNPHAPAPLRESDYEAIEAAVMETEKGRWFLAEYARRHRSSDTEVVLGAIAGLERMLKRERRPDVDRIRLDIGEMKDAIERTKLEIAQIKHDTATSGSKFDSASNELDAIVTQTETATSEILAAAEKIQEMAFTMREAGIDDATCDQLEELVMTMYTSCSFQDLTGQRTQKVVHVLRYLESRIDAMIDIWGMEEAEVQTTAKSSPDLGPVLDTRPDAHLLNGPQLAGHGVDQDHVDSLFGDMPSGGDVFDNDISFDDIDIGQDDDVFMSAGDAQLALPAPEADAIVLDDGGIPDVSDAAFDETEAADLDVAWAADAVDTTEAADDAEEPAIGDEALAHAAEAEEPDVTDEALARAAEAMEDAIETLKDVSAAVGRPLAVDPADDPFQRLTKAERQALLA